MNQPNIVCTGVRIVDCVIDEDGVISEVTPHGIPQFIEFGIKGGHVLKVYADGSYSDYDKWEFVEYCAPSNYPARRWLFHQFFTEHYPKLWQLYLLVRWWELKRGRLISWYLNKTEMRPNVLHGGFSEWEKWKNVRRYPFLRIPRWRDEQWRNSQQ